MARESGGALLLTFARRGEEQAIGEAVSVLRAVVHGGRIAAVGTPASRGVLAALGVEDVIVYGEGRGARSVVREVRARGLREAGIVYGGPRFSGHLKLELVALGSGARRVYRFRAGEGVRVVGRLRLLWSVGTKVLRAVACLAAGAAACGPALVWLGWKQMTAGGSRAGRA